MRLVGALLVCAAAPARGQQGGVVGIVRDSSGAPINGADVAVSGLDARARTGDDGRFRLPSLAAGETRLIVRRLGFRPIAHDVTVPAAGVANVELELTFVAPSLAAVVVRERRREVYDARLAGFYARHQRRVGGGYFVTRDRVERASSLRFTDLLRDVPGLRVGGAVRGGPLRAVRLRGNTCAPLVFIDGFAASAGEFDLDIIDTKSVEGIEVYGGMTGVPSELMGSDDRHRCGVIAVWTQPHRPRPRSVAAAARSSRPAASAASPVVDVRALLDSSHAYAADQVEEAAQLIAGSWVPTYPDSLWRAGVAGRVVTEFIVDTTGAMEPETLAIVTSTNAMFSAAVRAAVSSARFTPARRAGLAVRQLVQVPHVFEPGTPREETSSVRPGHAPPGGPSME